MKKNFSIFIILLTTALFIGCTTETKKNDYNIAYLSISFYNDMYKTSSSNIESLKNHESNYWTNENYAYCHISDWDFGENDTIILYLTDGRTLQTATENVLLMYEPEIE